MKKILYFLALASLTSGPLCAQIAESKTGSAKMNPAETNQVAFSADEAYPFKPTSDIVAFQEKAIFIPDSLRVMDLNDPNSKWSYHRMLSTPDVVLFWAPGFGSNIATAPDLEGHNMKVDLANLMDKVQQFYNFYTNDLKFLKVGSKAEKYKMMVMLDYSLEGTAYGGDYDGTIGALWIAPNRVQDKNLNCIAHELGHSFQLQTYCDGDQGIGGGGFFEMTSQWMLWQVNPMWQHDEKYHLDAFANLTHKAFLHFENIYHSPYVLEFWGEKHGLPFIGRMYREGTYKEDPAQVYMRLNNMAQKEFNDEMFHNYQRLVNWDIDRVRDVTRGFTDIWSTKLVDAGGGWQRVAPENAPENYGFNVIPIEVPADGKAVTVDFRGEAGRKGYTNFRTDKAGWRYGFVGIDTEGKEHYGDMQSAAKGKVSFKAPEGKKLEKLWLVVMGAPTQHWQNYEPAFEADDDPSSTNPHAVGDPVPDAQWPYSIRVK